jgi:hypothetical protein
MKKLLFYLLILIFTISSFAQKGWREKEMEVKVFIDGKKEAMLLYNLHLTGDVYVSSGYALMYVLPAELEQIKSLKLKYTILKDDLNACYKDFWNSKTEQYHTYNQIISLMDSLENAFPSICKKTVLGTSVQGREISFLKISDNVSVDENEAEVAFDGGIHGDELGGAENLIRFARYICNNYGLDPIITDLINNREIFIYPMVNPDGRVNMSRYNGNGVDCNRDFGYMWDGEGYSTAPYSQIETRLMRDFMYNNQFVTHITYHSGAEEVIFPWCYRADHASDYSCFYNQAFLYSSSSGYSSLPYLQSYADYPTNGELIDENYGINGNISLTMEISNNKQTTDILGYYNKNQTPMINIIKNAGYGLEGVVTDSVTGNPVAAAVFVNSFFPIYTDMHVGDYHKFVPPGTYTVKVVANGYETKTLSGIVVSSESATFSHIKLNPAIGRYAYKVVTAVIPNNNPADEANTPAIIGVLDNINYSIGKNGWIVLDMLQYVKNMPGNDFKIYEGDATAEGYTCYVSTSMDGPWTSLGPGAGTKEYDISPLDSVRFIKIVDDGDGTANTADAGFDLDAVEVLEQGASIFSFKDENNVSFTVFPNPANSYMLIENFNKTKTNYRLTLRNSQGLVVLSQSIAFNKSFKMDLSSFQNGIYFLTLQNDKTICTEKLVIQH